MLTGTNGLPISTGSLIPGAYPVLNRLCAGTNAPLPASDEYVLTLVVELYKYASEQDLNV